ncbi:ABC transporter permease [Garciella nitratireducens]|uniref:ABC transporter permease n=1 Tax=Garciella nitratireducens TaxID=218205 RepID=UPI000DE86268|nr:ABC transporter permease subunit [Garciella nitratireducens]RBP40655.1 taurine transport system permease protein [Garciella nitratireducens]
MKKIRKKRKIEKKLTLGTWTVIFVGWYLSTHFHIVSSVLVPSPFQVWNTFLEILTKGYNGISLIEHFGVSFRRLLIASFLAMITAIPLGLFSGYFDKAKAIIDSVVQFYRPLPPLAYYTLLILWFGIEDTSKIILLFLAAFAPIYIACVSAVTKMNQDYLFSAQSLGASQRKIFFYIVLPACLPEIFTGIRTAIGVAYTTLVAAEMVAATSGIGWMVIDASKYLKSDVIFVGIIFMGITGILIDKVLIFLEKKFVYWKGHV